MDLYQLVHCNEGTICIGNEEDSNCSKNGLELASFLLSSPTYMFYLFVQ